MMKDDTEFSLWLDRYQAIGKAQSRYMYLLAVLLVFFGLLMAQESSTAFFDTTPMKIPIIGLDVYPEPILAAGPILLGTVALALLGSLSAAIAPLARLDEISARKLSHESYDKTPNIIDMAVYSTTETGKFTKAAIWLSYPTFISLSVAEAIVLINRNAFHALSSKNWMELAVVSISVLLWIPVLLRLKAFWINRVSKAWNEVKRSNQAL